ncbi:hypothetical protein P167DRAFT_545599 [Morchella conica CCBAS932]|uniref:Uncharacterized protein n=1 Tax=Morchella conica CCBAS932 TaxID=1392247 RepID=A0A3N4KSJ0_9PEZI|nr:hypothetical protein P167DRAFT_545599 [Morchella conica CCBAS932]
MRFRILLLLLTAVYSLLTYLSSVVVAGPMRAPAANITNIAEAMAYHRDAYFLCLWLMSEHHHDTDDGSKASPTSIYHPQVTAAISSIRLHLANTRLNRPPLRNTIHPGTTPTAVSPRQCTPPVEHEHPPVTLNHYFPAPTESYAESIKFDEDTTGETDRPPLFPHLDIITEEEEDDIIRAVRAKNDLETKRFLTQLWFFVGGMFVWWWALLGW